MRPFRSWELRTAKQMPLSGTPGRSGGTRRPESGLTSPGGLRSAKASPLSWASGGPSGIVSYANQNETSPSLRAANCETAATFEGSWEVQRGGVICKPERDLPVPGGCELRNCRWFRWLLGGPAEWCHTQIRMRPRRPWGPRTANEATPSLGAATCKTVATFVGSWGDQRNGVRRKPK